MTGSSTGEIARGDGLRFRFYPFHKDEASDEFDHDLLVISTIYQSYSDK